MSKPIYKNIIFDSTDEIQFYIWCEIAKEYKIIQNFEFHPKSIELSESIKLNGKTLLRPHIYTADYLLSINKQQLFKLNKKKIIFNENNDNTYYIEIKPGFDKFHDTTKFIINQKWIFQKYNIFIYKIQVQKLFEKTFVPQKCRYTQKTHKLREKYKDLKTIHQFIGE